MLSYEQTIFIAYFDRGIKVEQLLWRNYRSNPYIGDTRGQDSPNVVLRAKMLYWIFRLRDQIRWTFVIGWHVTTCQFMSWHVNSCICMSWDVNSYLCMSWHVNSCLCMSWHVNSCQVVNITELSFISVYSSWLSMTCYYMFESWSVFLLYLYFCSV